MMIAQWVFWLNIAWIIGHELDAVRYQEWRFFAQPFSISDETAYRIFTILHLPIFMWMLWAMPNSTFQIGFDVFMILHAVVHFVLRKHPLIQFDNWFSYLMIFAPIPTSLVHLWLLFGV